MCIGRSPPFRGEVVASLCVGRTTLTCGGGCGCSMESTSKANCIHLSDSSRHILTPASTGEIPLVFRGNLTIKGKGSMVTYWILGYHPAADSHVSDSAPLNLSAPARLDSSNELRRKKNWAEFLASRLEASGGRVGMSGGEIGGSHRGSLPVRE
jgi:hypothetical protein